MKYHILINDIISIDLHSVDGHRKCVSLDMSLNGTLTNEFIGEKLYKDQAKWHHHDYLSLSPSLRRYAYRYICSTTIAMNLVSKTRNHQVGDKLSAEQRRVEPVSQYFRSPVEAYQYKKFLVEKKKQIATCYFDSKYCIDNVSG